MKRDDLMGGRALIFGTVGGLLLWIVIALAVALLVACGGGSVPSSINVSVSSASSSVSSSSATYSTTSATPPTQSCPVGVTQNYAPVCVCASQYVNGSTCTVPPQQSSSSSSYSPPPTMSLSAEPDGVMPGAYQLIWTSSNVQECVGASGFPVSGVLPANGQVDTLVLTVTTSYVLTCSGPGGDAQASVTIYVHGGSSSSSSSQSQSSSSSSAPTFTITLAATPPAIVTSDACPTDANGTPCKGFIVVTDSIGDESETACSMNGGAQQFANAAWLVGPYATTGPVVFAFSCTDRFGDVATGSITVNVIVPYFPPPDTFSVAGSNPYVFTWNTSSADGQGGCSVELVNINGVETTLVPGGTPSGSASTATLSPAYSPYSATLWCSGVPDPGVPSIGVSP